MNSVPCFFHFKGSWGTDPKGSFPILLTSAHQFHMTRVVIFPIFTDTPEYMIVNRYLALQHWELLVPGE